MIIAIQNSSKCASINRSRMMSSESGAALATAILMLALLSAIAMTVLAVVQTETRIAASDLERTQAFYAASAGIEKMTSDFSQLFSQTSKPTTTQLNSIAASAPEGLDDEGYTLTQTLAQDATTLAAMRTTQGILAPKYPSVLMPNDSPFGGLNASVNPFTLTSVARATDGTEVGLTRQMNNYMIPIFQFGVFSDNDLEFWPEPPMTFNGRVHSNGNIYFGGDCTFLAKVTTANEAVRNKMRNNADNTTTVGSGTGAFTSNPRWKLTPTGTPIALGQGSVTGGPNLTQPRADGRGDFNGTPAGFNPSPSGTNNTTWSTYSVNPFGGLLLTNTTGVKALKLPLQLSQTNKQPFELIKRTMPDDSLPGFDALDSSRYQTKARIRILIDDEGVGNGTSNAAGIGNDPVTGLQKGVALSEFSPVALDGGRALRPVNDNGTYASTVDWFQGDPGRNRIAQTVRGVRNDYAPLIAAATASTAGGGRATSLNYTANNSNGSIPKSPNGAVIPPGAGIKGRILIEIVPPIAADGTQPAPIDVTTTILSMGMTVGEPNAIVMLQRPEWANFMQGSRDRKGSNMYLTYFLHNGSSTDGTVGTRRALADGEVALNVPFNAAGFITTSLDNNLDDDPHPTATPNQFTPTAASMARDDKPFTITVTGVGAPAGAVAVTVGSLTQALPSGTVLDFGGGKSARLTASAAVGAIALVVSPLTAALVPNDFAQSGLNRIVPINVYNVREGRMDEALTSTNAYQRGITSVIEINMRNLARWVDGVYDTTLFNGITTANSPVSANIEGSDGYTVYISDRRGDRVKGERNSAGSTIQTTNGAVDNEDIYNYGAGTPALDPGEDVIDDGYDVGLSLNKRGSLQLDKCELPSPVAITAAAAARPTGAGSVTQSRFDMAAHVSRWNPVRDTSLPCSTNQYWFRRGVRVFNGENLQISGGSGLLSQTKGITIATENMMYIWGNYNTTGINAAPSPTGTSSLNESSSASRYNGSQVPASLVADAVFPVSKTWYDALPAMYPEGWIYRVADAGNSTDTSTIAVGLETAVRAGVIAGSTQSAMVGTTVPTGADNLDWLNGGVHNFPRFLESWSIPNYALPSGVSPREDRWNYVGSFIILYNSTQAVAPWSVGGAVVYYPPIRNWAFDITFTDPNRLPPGTPQFQYVEPTGFRQIL